MPDFNADVPPAPPPFPVQAVSVDVGLGKTRTWRERVAPALVGGEFTGVLAVPRHRLGDEIVRDLAEAGITACVYRGREAADPAQLGEKMCRELDRATMISDALSSVAPYACKYKETECDFYRLCGYQRQRSASPDIWIVPHQLLYRMRPSFISQPDTLAIDEAFWNASLHGIDRPYKLWLSALDEHREIYSSGPLGAVRDAAATADLMEISRRVHRALQWENDGRIRRLALTEVGITSADLRLALRLEWRRKIEAEVRPGMPLARVREICTKIIPHNQAVAKLARFWELLLRTIEISCERSPWLDLRKAQPMPGGEGTAPAIIMIWRDDIHPSWRAPTLIMDATMPVGIVKQFFPDMAEPCRIAAPMPHTRVRQITDRPMTADMLIPTEGASERANATRRANVERVQRFIEVRATEVFPGKVLVVCQLGLETALVAGGRPSDVQVRHFNDIAGENVWSDVALVIVIGRTEPAPGTVERTARALFGIPIIFPWFGPSRHASAAPQHGFARTAPWHLDGVETAGRESLILTFSLSDSDVGSQFWPEPFRATYTVVLAQTLSLRLAVQNRATHPIIFEEALHAYFAISDIANIAISGLTGTTYIDKTDAARRKRQTAGLVTITAETDSVYLDTPGQCSIEDRGWRRRVVIKKDAAVSSSKRTPPCRHQKGRRRVERGVESVG